MSGAIDFSEDGGRRDEDGVNGHHGAGNGYRAGTGRFSNETTLSPTTLNSTLPPPSSSPGSGDHHPLPSGVSAGRDASPQGSGSHNAGSSFYSGLPVESPQATVGSRPSMGDRMSSTASTLGGMNTALSGLGGLSVDDKGPIPVGFDEGVLRGLCEMDCALPLLADRIKQSIASCKQVAVFFRSRAEVEEKYARSLIELLRTTGDVYSRADCKSGTFVSAYQGGLKLQEQIAHGRLRFAQRLNEMSDELLGLAREGEKLRKQHKENGQRYQNILQESEQAMDKAKSRFDATAEELERVLVAKEGESIKESGMRTSTSSSSSNISAGGVGGAGGKKAFNKAMTKGGLLFKGKNPGSIAKQEDDVRTRMAAASDTFRKTVLESQSLRQEYFNFQLPKILRLLKECADELDLGTQYHLTRFAYLYESTMVADGSLLSPMQHDDAGPLGLKGIYESIDNRTDFKSYMQNYAVARGGPKGPRRDGAYDESYHPTVTHISNPRENPNLPSGTTTSNGHLQQAVIGSPENYSVPGIPSVTGASFGVDLGEQLARDGVEVPKVVQKCAEAIEAYGLESMGIYRLSGTTSRVQALKASLDNDIEHTDVMSEEWSADINVVSGALKLWFRELPEPLLTYGLYHAFIEAARYENDRLRHIRLHEQVNELPDPNYATLKFFMGHLDRVRRKDSVNQMSVSNLSIVFGPTLLGAPPEEGGLNLEHMSFQCKAIETILEKYNEIFVEEQEDPPASA